MNQEKRILVCEDSMEGIFSAVYDGWKECAGGCKVSIQTSFPVSMELFTSYREIATDQSKAGKVMRTILMRLGSEVYEQICLAAASADEDRGTAIFATLDTYGSASASITRFSHLPPPKARCST